ncbi:DUF192 domain-containing protein [Alcaligenaceae bacterium]|nr:DUF192 domain-containing protein [Alcaligenaceae bacterium]
MGTLRLYYARTFSARLLGLHAYPRLSQDTGLCIAPCAGVHTFFLSYAIDVVFFDARQQVLKTVHGLNPFKLSYCRAAAFAVELPAGHCAANPGYAREIRSALAKTQGAGWSVG